MQQVLSLAYVSARAQPNPMLTGLITKAQVQVNPAYGTWNATSGVTRRAAPDRRLMTGRVVVVGLGPGDPRLVSVAAGTGHRRRPRSASCARPGHPSAGLVEPATSFDRLYERAGSIDEVYAGIVEDLVAAAGAARRRCCTPCRARPLVAERTVELLRADRRVEVESCRPCRSSTWPGPGSGSIRSQPGCAWSTGTVSPRRQPARPARSWSPSATARWCSPTIKLAVDDGPDVTVLQRLGLPDEAVTTVAWDELDRAVEPDHLTCLWIPDPGRAGRRRAGPASPSWSAPCGPAARGTGARPTRA